MHVVLPVCHKDLHLAALGLRVAAKLDGGTAPFDCTLLHEEKLDVKEVVALARTYFRKVRVEAYPTCPYGNAFPHPHNWAWQHAARLMARQDKPWLWWEPDAVPVRAGWLPAIKKAYQRGEKPFGGWVVNKPDGSYLAGVAVYPRNVAETAVNAMITRQGPFDLVLSKLDYALSRAKHMNGVIWHDYREDGGSREWKSLDEMPLQTVLFHRCKSGELHELLLRNGTTATSVRPVSDVTVVITNFQRPEHLWPCFRSCLDAKAAHIIVSSSAVTPAVKELHEKMLEVKPDVVISAIPEDRGCNETWLRGVDLAKTGKVTILHDDDWLLPEYEEVVAGRFDAADVVHWDGAKHLNGEPFHGSYVTRSDLPEGLHPIGYLLSFLLSPGCHTISPVGGLYPRDLALSVLKECAANFGPEFHTRPSMMVGNDLLLWLRACERLKTVYYTHIPRISYGHWSESESYRDSGQKEMKLLPIYDRTRAYWLERTRRIFHTLSRYAFASDPLCTAPVMHRFRSALTTWELAYSRGLVVPCPMWVAPRTSWTVRDTQMTHFLKDVLRHGMNSAGSGGDLICLTNDDTMINQYWWYDIYSTLLSRGAVCSFRRNLKREQDIPYDIFPATVAGVRHVGRDAFAFTRDWLETHWEEIPDYALGYSDWDSTLAMLIRLTQGDKPTPDEFTKELDSSELPSRYIYHLDHPARWVEVGQENPGNAYNRSLTVKFFADRLGWAVPHLRGEW